MTSQFREVFLTKAYLGISMEYAAGGDMFDFFVRNKAFVNAKARAEPLERGPLLPLIALLPAPRPHVPWRSHRRTRELGHGCLNMASCGGPITR